MCGMIISMLTTISAKTTLDGIYYADIVRVYFENDLGDIELISTEHGIRTQFESLNRILDDYQVASIEQWIPTSTEKDRDGDWYIGRYYQLYFPEVRQNIQTTVKVFGSDPHIRFSERVPVHRIDYTPNDTRYNQQWYLPIIQAPEAWDLWDIAGGENPGDPSIVVGVIDTGCDWDHNDLRDNLWQNLAEDADGDGSTIEQVGNTWQLDQDDINGIDEDGNGYIDDLIGWDVADNDNDPTGPSGQGINMHGTHVAGISAAVTNNGNGVASSGWSIQHMVVKCAQDSDPDGGIWNGFTAIQYAAKTGANIINCSWGGGGFSAGEQNVINNVYNNYGVIVVASAGNGDDNGNEEYAAHYPASYENVISVTALGPGDNWNHWATYHESVDFAAPGESILSTVYSNISGGYQSWDGTSMSAPVVSSCFGLLWSFFPDSSNNWIENTLLDNCDDIYEINSDPEYAGRLGRGRPNIHKAIVSGVFPSLSVLSYSLQIDNDDDGQLNPGENALMRIILRNDDGYATATDISAVLSSSSPDIIITDDTGTWDNPIPGGNTGLNLVDRFAFSITDDATPSGIPVTLTITSGEPSLEYEAVELFEIDVTLNQVGFPFTTGNTIQSSPIIFDIDKDGENEIVAASDDFNVYMLNKSGNLEWSFATGNQIWASPAVSDLEGDGDMEIIIGSKDKNLYILNSDGSVQLQYTADNFLMTTSAIIDMDGDGDREIIFGDFGGKLYAIHHDGSDVNHFPIEIGESIMAAPAVGDLNKDGLVDIVVGTWSNNIHVYSSDGSLMSGFPYVTGNRINSEPVLADLDGNGDLEIIVGSDDNKLHVINHDGSLVFSYTTESDIKGSASVEDIDGDGNLEIFFGSNDGKLYGIDHEGNDLIGWPYSTLAPVASSPVFFDLDNDGSPEIISAEANGDLFALTTAGELISNFAVPTNGSINGSFSIGDLDGDGDPEIAFGSSNSVFVIDVKSQHSGTHYWRMDRGNPHRTGNREDYHLVSVDSDISVLPQKFEVHPSFPNPFNPVASLKYELPEDGYVSVEIYNLLGHLVTTLLSERQNAGIHTVSWNAKSYIHSVSSGVYLIRIKTEDNVAVQKLVYLK